MASTTIGRREFLGQTAAAGALWALSPAARVLGANDRIRLGIIGAGARGQELLGQLLKLVDEANQNAQLVAVADVYTRRHDEVRKDFPDIKAVTDAKNDTTSRRLTIGHPAVCSVIPKRPRTSACPSGVAAPWLPIAGKMNGAIP